MKKILLSLALSVSTFAISQTLQTENFNSMTIGNIGTDITGATAGQGSWLTFATNDVDPTTSTNAATNNFQVVATGNASTQGLQITSPNGDKGTRFMWKNGLETSWAARTSGNNIIEVEYDFFTGPVTDSRTQIGARIFGTENVAGVPTARILNGFIYTTNTRVLSGVVYAQNGTTFGNFLITFATGGLVLDANTWYSIGCSYNTVTGEMLWKTSPTAGASGLGVANWVPGLLPTEVDFVQAVVGANATAVPPVPANTVTSNIIFDNYISRAVATSNLLNAADFATIGNETISIYPNPTKDILNLKVAGLEMISAIQIVDLNGRQMVAKTFNNVSDAQINVSDLSAGMYLINVTSGDQTVTKKFLKQ